MTTTEIVPLEHDPEPPGPPTLFGTRNPALALQRMSEVATALVDVIRDRKLVVRINGREHLTAEAWQTLAGMLGIVPVVEWTRQLEDGWEARAQAFTLDGRLVGAAESMCTRSETTWKRRDEYALRSMAQTRAISRALRAPLSQIVKMAGYDPTGAEEIPAAAESPPVDHGKIPAEIRPDEHQLRQINALLEQLAEDDPDTDWPARARELAGVPGNQLTRTVADRLIRQLGEIAA
jgi:hypothetical protein